MKFMDLILMQNWFEQATDFTVEKISNERLFGKKNRISGKILRR